MPPHYTHRTNGFLRIEGFSEETATNMAYSPTRRISGYATDSADDAICPIFHVRYLGRGPVAAAGRDYVSPVVDSLFRQAPRKHLPKTTLFISAQGIRVGQPRGGRSTIPVSFVPIHDCLYGAADRIHKEVFSLVVKGTGRGNPFECMSFVCHKSAHSTALALWLNKAFKEAYEVWQTQRPEPRGFERNVRRNPSFQHQQRPVEEQYSAYSSVDRGQRRYQRSNSESTYVNGDYRSEPLGDGVYRGSSRYSSTPAYAPQKRTEPEKEGGGFGSFFRRSKRGSSREERGSREVVYTPPEQQDNTRNSPRRSSFGLPEKPPWKKREKRESEKEKKKKEKKEMKKQEDLYTPRERFVYRNPELSYSVETLDDVSIQSEDRGRSGRRYLRKQRTASEERELKPPSPVPKRPLSQLLQPTPFTVALEKKASPEPTKKDTQIPKKRTSTEKSLSDERRQPPKKPSPQPVAEVRSPPPLQQDRRERREEPRPQQNGEIDFSGIVDTDAFIDDVFDGIDYDIFSDDDQTAGKPANDNSEEHTTEKDRDASNKENWPDFSTAYISPNSSRGNHDVPRWTNIFGKTPPPGMSPESGAKFSQYQPKALRGDATDISRADVQRAREQPREIERRRRESEDDGYTSIVVKENEVPVRYSQALKDYEQSSRSKPNGVINNHYDSKGSGDVKNLYNLVGSKSFWETRVDMGKSMLY